MCKLCCRNKKRLKPAILKRARDKLDRELDILGHVMDIRTSNRAFNYLFKGKNAKDDFDLHEDDLLELTESEHSDQEPKKNDSQLIESKTIELPRRPTSPNNSELTSS